MNNGLGLVQIAILSLPRFGSGLESGVWSMDDEMERRWCSFGQHGRAVTSLRALIMGSSVASVKIPIGEGSRRPHNE